MRKQKKKTQAAAKKSAKKTTRQASKKKIALKKTKKPLKSAPKKLTAKNRRKHPRLVLKNVWATELSGDYRFVLPVGDLSEGGAFLKGRMKTSREASELTLHLGNSGSMTVTALPIYDRLAKKGYGTGYRFLDIKPSQLKTLRSYLRNLD